MTNARDVLAAALGRRTRRGEERGQEARRPRDWRRLSRFASTWARRSITARLIVTSFVAIVLALFVAGFLLYEFYSRSLERTFDARLNIYLAVLAAEAVTEKGELVQAGDLGEPRFNLPLSGWYWQIKPKGALEPEQASISLFDGLLTLPDETQPDMLGVRRGYTQGPGDDRLRMIERDIQIADGRTYSFAIAGEDVEIVDDKAMFARNLRAMLSAFALFLFAVMGVQVWFGIRPLGAVRHELQRVRLGRTEALGGMFPSEVQPLVDDLNALIRSNAEIVQRSRTHVGNLAHALKTPLSVVVNEARAMDNPEGTKIVEQSGLMRERIDHALSRARMAASASVIGAVTNAADAIHPLVRSMERIYREKAIIIEASVPQGMRFRGERQDFEEIVGNLLDNACKWAHSRVTVAVAGEVAWPDLRFLTLIVEDDGPGLSDEEVALALKRGQRLDETKPGSGLGLSIVGELVTLYGGEFRLGRGSLGGLQATVRLPAI